MTYGTSMNSGTDQTSLSASSSGGAFYVYNNSSGPALVADTGDVSGTGIPIETIPPVGGSSLLLAGTAASAGPPTSGSHRRGELYQDLNGVLFYCTSGGLIGTWANLSDGERLVTLGTPARVYDSRIGQEPSTGPKSQITNGGIVKLVVTGPKAGGGNSGVPSGATAVLGNITMVNGPNTTFLTVFAAGAAPPSTSNVNALGGQVIANNFTSQVGTSDEISIQCGFGPTDFIIDLFGYYP
jgi:hypothetical protein